MHDTEFQAIFLAILHLFFALVQSQINKSVADNKYKDLTSHQYLSIFGRFNTPYQ